jgi:hypothetical protein
MLESGKDLERYHADLSLNLFVRLKVVNIIGYSFFASSKGLWLASGQKKQFRYSLGYIKFYVQENHHVFPKTKIPLCRFDSHILSTTLVSDSSFVSQSHLISSMGATLNLPSRYSLKMLSMVSFF